MDEILRNIFLAIRGMWSRRWVGLAVAWAVAVIGTVYILRFPQYFEASSRIFVDTQSVLKPLMAGLTVQPNVEQQVAMLGRTLISRPNIEKLIARAELESAPSGKDAQIDEMLKRLQINTAGRENLYLITFRDPDPERARKVVASLADMFVETNAGQSRIGSDEAKRFVEDQIKVYEKKLEEAENRLKQFRLLHLGQAAGGMDFFGRIDELKRRLNDARLELREAEQSRDALRRQIAAEEPLLTVAVAPVAVVPSELDVRIDVLKRNLDSLLQKYTEQHPDVAGTRRVILELEEQRRKEAVARDRSKGAPTASSNASNPVYQQIKVSLAASEATAASLRARVSEYERQYQQLMGSARMVPEIDAQLAQLNRDYEVNKKNYEALVTRRESAEMSGDLESAGALAEFRVVDPPRVSPRPVGPSRLILMVGLLFAALGAGGAASFAVARVWPTFLDSQTLRERTNLPVLGSVSMQLSDEKQTAARRGLAGFIVGVLGLVAAHLSILVMLFFMNSRVG